MARFILDTGIVLGFVRGAGYADYVRRKYAPSVAPNLAMLSVVTVGELRSLAHRLAWGEKKLDTLDSLLHSMPVVDIKHDSIVNLFAEIDAYNHGRHPNIDLPTSTRIMGDNDTWIAATTSCLNATLLTADKDFLHLDGVFLSVEYIDQKLTGDDA